MINHKMKVPWLIVAAERRTVHQKADEQNGRCRAVIEWFRLQERHYSVKDKQM